MNIHDFEEQISPEIMKKARKLAERNMTTTLNVYTDGTYECWLRDSEPGYYYGNHVEVVLSDSGELEYSRCDRLCREEYCVHKSALMIIVKERFDRDLARRRDDILSELIDGYCDDETEPEESVKPESIRVVPVLSSDKTGLIKCSLKTGAEKLYSVPDIADLKTAYETGSIRNYGKNFSYRHTYSLLDEQSRNLMDMVYYFYSSSSDRLTKGYKKEDTKRSVAIKGKRIDSFFELYREQYISCNGKDYFVCFQNPEIFFEVSEDSSAKGYNIRLNPLRYTYYGHGRRACFIDDENRIFYITSTGFCRSVTKLLECCIINNSIHITGKRMSAFYSAVLRPVSRYARVRGIEMLEDFVPPELEAKLFIDTLNDGVCARMEFVYGDRTFTGFYDQDKNPFCDYPAEKAARNVFSRYFTDESDENPGTYILQGDDELYSLLSSGLPEFERVMDVYVSDAFKKIGIRQPVRPAIGIRPSGNLLELEITAEGYTMDELVGMLKSYRKGARYHRLKDGSFALLGDSVTELADVTESLNISDKALLKNRLSVPKYRMMYLDGLKKSCDNIRINRSAEFKKAVSSFGLMIEDSENLSVPKSLENTMREYQKYGFRWLKTISGYGFGGILADDMGLGKTIQAISLMLSDKQNSENHKPNLVVCPASLTMNWENEIKRFAPELNTLAVTGTIAERELLISDAEKYDVVITPYSLITRDIDKYEKIDFHIQFIDEAQYIKNQNTQAARAVKTIKADTRFALTGTPVENSLAELWSIFDYIMPDYLYSYTYFKKNFEAPITAKKEEKVVKALQKIISPFVLRRMKKEVLKELPDKTETVMYAGMGEEQSSLYSANVADFKETLKKEIKDGSDRIKILAMLTRLRQICCDPSLVYDNYNGGSAKLEQCMELVSNCVTSGHKILLFSQFTSMLDIISERLEREGISFYTITGKTKPAERIRLVSQFNEDDTNVFLISLKAGGTGLNLTGADIVIHYDPWWNLSAENQASDRAYRIGQKRNVQIYKLITSRTIEEKIIRLQEKKAELYDIAVNGEGDIMKMSADDILSILE